MFKYLFLIVALLLAGCASIDQNAPAFIKSAWDSVDTINRSAKNLLQSGVIDKEDAKQVADTVEFEIIPRIEAAEAAYAEYLVQIRVHGLDNGGDHTAEQYILFASDYINGLTCQLKLAGCR